MLNDLYQILDPVAFSIGPFAVRWYGLAYVAGFLLAGLIIYRTAKRWKVNLDLDTLSTVVIVIIVGILLGGRLGYCIFYGDGEYLKDPIEVLRIQNGGMSFHGALFLGALLGVIVCRKIGMPALTFADLACVGIPVGLFFGRVANFINGELWGAPTDLPWGVVFGGYAGTVPRHPSQLYEAFLEGVVIFVILFILSRKNPPLKQGTYSGLFLVLYGVFRIAVEFVREPDVQVGYLFGDWLTMGMVLSVPLLFIGAGLLIYAAVVKRDQEGLQYIEEEEEPDVQKKNRKLAPNESEYVLNEDGEYVLNENDYVPSFHGFEKIPKRNKYGKVGVVYELELDPELFSSDDDLDEFDDYQEYAPFDELDEYQSEQAIDELDEPEYAYDSDYDYEYEYDTDYQPSGEEISEYADIESSEFAEEDWRGDMFGQVQEIKPHSFAGAVKKVSDAILSTYDTPPFPIVPASTSAEITAELEAVSPEEIESAEVEVADVEAIEAEATEVETTEPEAAETEATVTEPKQPEETEVETTEAEATTASDAEDAEMTELQLSDGGTEEVVMPEVEAEVVEEPAVIKAKDEDVEAKPIKAKVKETLHMEDFPEPGDVFGAEKFTSAEDIPAPLGTESVAEREATNKPTKRKKRKVEKVKEKKSKLSGFDLAAELDRLREAAQANLPKDTEEPKSNILPVTHEENEPPLLQEPKVEEPEVAESKAEAEAAPEVEPAPEFAPEPAAVSEPEPEPSTAPEPSAEPDPEPEMKPVPEPKPEPVPEVEITETSKEEQKEEPKTEAKAEVKEETKEEVQEEVAHEPKKVPAPEPENLEEAKEEAKQEFKVEVEEELEEEPKEELKEQNSKPKDKSLEEAEKTIDDVLSLKLFGKNSDKSRANMRDVLAQRIVKNEKNEKDEKKSYVKNRIKKGKFFKR